MLKTYTVYPNKVEKNQEAIIEYLEKGGDVDTFSDKKLAELWVEKFGGWIEEVDSDREVYEDCLKDDIDKAIHLIESIK